MPKLSTDDYSITINGTNFSDHLDSIDFRVTKEVYESTGFGQKWEETTASEIKAFQIDLEFHQDYSAASVNAVIWPLVVGTGLATVVAKPTSGSVSATNPSYTGVAIPAEYSPIGGAIKNIAKVSVSWRGTGTVTQGTA